MLKMVGKKIFTILRSKYCLSKSIFAVHKCAICELASEGDSLVSSDEDGNIYMWKVAGNSLQQAGKITGLG